MAEKQEMTRLLRAFRDGDRAACDRLLELVYADCCSTGLSESR